MGQILLIGLALLILSGCSAHPIYNIKASTPAYIEIDGVVVCETTPCKVTPPHYVRAFGDCADGAMMQSIVTAFPIDKSKGFVQQKQIRATCKDNKIVNFDMEAIGAVQTIPTSDKN